MTEPSAFFDEPQPAPTRSHKAAARQKRKAEKVEKTEPGRAKPLVAKTEKQARYLAALRSGDSAFAVGGAGTGKTYVASRIAAQKLVRGEIEKIVICRVSVSKAKHKNGFLPGKLDQKLAPWMVPVMDGLRAEVSAKQIETWTAEGRFEIASFEHMRGRTFSDAFVILDEAQNCDLGDLRMFLTRIGMNSQVVVTGDMDQIDIEDSGLAEVLDMVEKDDLPMHIIEFGSGDVVRSQFAKAFVQAFERRSRRPANDANLDTQPAFLHAPRRVTSAA